MSKGLGKVATHLKQMVDTHGWVLVYQFAALHYLGGSDTGQPLERKHKVSALRAARLLESTGDYTLTQGTGTQDMGEMGTLHLSGYALFKAGTGLFEIYKHKSQKEMGAKVGISQSTVSRRLDSTGLGWIRLERINSQEAWIEPIK